MVYPPLLSATFIVAMTTTLAAALCEDPRSHANRGFAFLNFASVEVAEAGGPTIAAVVRIFFLKQKRYGWVGCHFFLENAFRP